jgi:hypothetical protein|tara:strand:+ start:1157 stop:1375 length:219 start_codon:yes stop_codon:yes gene_type:complete
LKCPKNRCFFTVKSEKQLSRSPKIRRAGCGTNSTENLPKNIKPKPKNNAERTPLNTGKWGKMKKGREQRKHQ